MSLNEEIGGPLSSLIPKTGISTWNFSANTQYNIAFDCGVTPL
jgi:hypothetical protein